MLKNIKNRFDNTIDELETKMLLFKTEMSSKEQELIESKSNLERDNVRCDVINRDAQEIDRQLTTLFAHSEQQQEAYDEKARYIRDICERLNIPISFDLGNDNKRAEAVAKQAETAVVGEEKKVDQLHKNNDQTQTTHEQRITELRNKKVTIETALKGKRDQWKQLKEDVTKHTEAIAIIERHASKQKDVTEKIEALQKKFDDPKVTQYIDTTQDHLLVNHTRSAELNAEIESLDEQISVLSKHATILAQVNAKEKQMEKYENDIRRIRNKHADNLDELLNGEKIEKNYKQRVEQESQRLRTEIDRIEKEMRINDNQLSECLHSHKSKKHELSRLEAKLREMKDKIYENCQSTPFAEVLAETKENAAKAQMEHSALQSAKAFYKDYIDKMRKKPCCPLCHKDLNGNEVEDLNDELNVQIDSLPSKIRQTEQTFKETNEKLERLLALQPAVESVNTIRDDSIPLLERELVDIDKKRALAQTQKTKLEKSLEQPKERIEIAQRMVGDMSLLDDSLREGERVRNELLQLKVTLPGTSSRQLSLEDAQARRKALSDEKKQLDGETRKMENDLKEEQKRRTRMQQVLFELKEQEIRMKEGIQSLEEKRARVTELNAKIADLDANIREMETSSVPIENDLKRAIEMKEQEKAKNAKQLKDAQIKVNELKQKVSAINRCRDEIRRLAAMKLEENIKENQNKLTDLKRQKDEAVSKTTIGLVEF